MLLMRIQTANHCFRQELGAALLSAVVIAMKIVVINAPEYRIDSKPDYMAVGTKVDRLIGSSFEDGKYVVRAIGSSDHPGKDLVDLAAIILKSGTDKYDADR